MKCVTANNNYLMNENKYFLVLFLIFLHNNHILVLLRKVLKELLYFGLTLCKTMNRFIKSHQNSHHYNMKIKWCNSNESPATAKAYFTVMQGNAGPRLHYSSPAEIIPHVSNFSL